MASLIPDSSLAREALLFPTASRASRHRLHNAGSWPTFPGKFPLPRAHRDSSGPSFLCIFSEIKRRQRERRHVPETLGPVTRRARPGRVGRRAATRKRIHIETLPHVLDEVGRLLAMRQLFIRFHSAAAARRVLQLFSSKEPARRRSTARRHDTSSSARTLSPPPPRLPKTPRQCIEAPPQCAFRRVSHAFSGPAATHAHAQGPAPSRPPPLGGTTMLRASCHWEVP